MGAGLLLLVGGVGYRLAAAHLGRTSTGIPLPRGTLARLPLEIGEWTGRDVPLDAQIIRATATDDHVNRLYVRQASREAAAVFIAYGVRPRDLLPHRPEVCYPGAGWTYERTRMENIACADGSPLPCQIHSFHRGGLEAKRITVLNYYIVDGRLCGDISALRSLSWAHDGPSGYVAQVQIACNDSLPSERADNTVRRFAADSGDAIRTLLRGTATAAQAESDAIRN